jgi:hypothetical protein
MNFGLIIAAGIFLLAFLGTSTTRFPEFPILSSQWNRWDDSAPYQSAWPMTVHSFDPGRPSRWVRQDTQVLAILGLWFVVISGLARWLAADFPATEHKPWLAVATVLGLLPLGYYIAFAWAGIGVLARGGFVARGRLIHLALLGCALGLVYVGFLPGLGLTVALVAAACLIVWSTLPHCVERHLLLGAGRRHLLHVPQRRGLHHQLGMVTAQQRCEHRRIGEEVVGELLELAA